MVQRSASRPLRATSASVRPVGASRFVWPAGPVLDSSFCRFLQNLPGLHTCAEFSQLLQGSAKFPYLFFSCVFAHHLQSPVGKLFKIYVARSPLASPWGRLGSIPWVLRFGHCTTPESHGVYLDPTQFHRTSNITETDISKDLRPMKTRQTALQICSA